MYCDFSEIKLEDILCKLNGYYHTAQTPDLYHPIDIKRGREDTTISQKILHLDDTSVFRAFESMIMSLENSHIKNRGIKDTRIVLSDGEYRVENKHLTYKKSQGQPHNQQATLVITARNEDITDLLEVTLTQAKNYAQQAALLQTPKP